METIEKQVIKSATSAQNKMIIKLYTIYVCINGVKHKSRDRYGYLLVALAGYKTGHRLINHYS